MLPWFDLILAPYTNIEGSRCLTHIGTGGTDGAAALLERARSVASQAADADVVRTSDLAEAILRRDANARQRSKSARELLREWLADETGYDEKAWPALKKELEEDRLSFRRLFHA